MIDKKAPLIAITVILIAAVIVTVLTFALNPEGDAIDITAFNRLADRLGNDWESAKSNNFEYDADGEYTVIDLSGNILHGERIGDSYRETLNRAAINGYPVFDIISGGNLVGKLIVTGVDVRGEGNSAATYAVTTAVFYIALILSVVIYFCYLEFIVFRPFKRMSDYASFIANGELDIPLKMDRGNIFGAFTESFNTMRLQLKAARAAENKARKDKESFISEINHDMLSPLAVIKAACQNMAMGGGEQHLDLIESKTEELESILNDLMTANLQDSAEYKMYIDEISSEKLEKLIRMCDYKGKIRSLAIERCLIKCDEVRTSQIFSNVINNSYKYADTDIDITGVVLNGRLIVTVRDYGDTLDPKEIDRLTERYFRGSNADSGNGAGLGLYIAETCQRLQDGDLYLKYDGGLTVILVFALS